MREFSEQEQVRRNKLEEIAKVCNPYPDKFERTHTCADFVKKYDKFSHEELQSNNDQIKVENVLAGTVLTLDDVVITGWKKGVGENVNITLVDATNIASLTINGKTVYDGAYKYILEQVGNTGDVKVTKDYVTGKYRDIKRKFI